MVDLMFGPKASSLSTLFGLLNRTAIGNTPKP